MNAMVVRPWIFMIGFSLENTDFYSPEIRIYGNESSFLSKDGKYEGLSEVKISYLERTEEGDEERYREIHAETVEDGDNDEVLA